ncbi:MAG: zinc-binding dehydrogenase [Chlamydiae bacterium]|nr:zinc-binding dehydrogenase [Chlamydiota bacterium]MBI3276245.1 zinc-binding dehydrogenase [Chlamydiota bacterium]
MKTQAAVLFEVCKPLQLIPVTIPSLKSGQVLVDVAYSSICHSQLLEVLGKRGPDRFLPHTLGHEGSGTVLEVGSDVVKVKPGDRVVLSWIKGKGKDVPSMVYQSDEGPVNSGAISTFMRRTITCENRLTPILDSMPLREAALLGCAIPTGAGIVLKVAKISEGESVAIFGIGGVGLSALMAASFVKAHKIIAVDIFDHKLKQAKQLGATHTINGMSCDVAIEILNMTNGLGVDYAIEASGKKQAMEAAFRSVRDQGGICVIAGNLSQGDLILIDPMDLIKGKKILGSWGGSAQTDEDIPFYANLFLSGDLPLKSMITHEYGLQDINQALKELEQGNAGRIMIKMED